MRIRCSIDEVHVKQNTLRRHVLSHTDVRANMQTCQQNNETLTELNKTSASAILIIGANTVMMNTKIVMCIYTCMCM